MFERSSPSAQVLAGDEIADDVTRHVLAAVLRRSSEPRGLQLDEVVHESIYTEQKRLARAESNTRATADVTFTTWLRHELARAQDDTRRRDLVREIVSRYAREISGHFDSRVYRATTRMLPSALGLLLHGDVEEQVLLEGEIDALRSLATLGTVILAPSHVSNLDSVILGYAIYRLGLPPFAYGAGLNLFSNATIGFFMRNLGAYTVDRNKTDPLYKETLKEYACELLEHGQHSLFFPGGTRSRSGSVESRLKKGLLGSAPRAFRRALERGSARPKIFVVPCTLTYPLVLEASSLVGDFLRAEGGAHYIDVHDEFDRPRQWAEFIRGLLALDLRIHVHVGGALDPIGNRVDAEGESMDPRGRRIDASRYFLADGKLVEDDARDAEYTRLLESRLIDSYRHDTIALPSSVLARAVFDRLRRTQRQPDLFRFLRGLEIDPWVPADEVERDVALLQAELVELSRSKEIRVAPELLRARPETLIASALATFATYHAVPVIERQGARLRVGDPNLLYYYASRLFHVVARPT